MLQPQGCPGVTNWLTDSWVLVVMVEEPLRKTMCRRLVFRCLENSPGPCIAQELRLQQH